MALSLAGKCSVLFEKWRDVVLDFYLRKEFLLYYGAFLQLDCAYDIEAAEIK